LVVHVPYCLFHGENTGSIPVGRAIATDWFVELNLPIEHIYSGFLT